MPKPLSKITNGTIGGLACEISMNNILVRLNDAHVTRKVMSRYEAFKGDLKALEQLRGQKIWNAAVRLFREHHFKQADNLQEQIPQTLYTHLKCCMTAQYRRTLEGTDG